MSVGGDSAAGNCEWASNGDSHAGPQGVVGSPDKGLHGGNCCGCWDRAVCFGAFEGTLLLGLGMSGMGGSVSETYPSAGLHGMDVAIADCAPTAAY